MSNRRALGRKDKPLRTVDQVLDAMLEQTELSIRADQRALMLSKLKRGQTLENSPRVQEALEIWMEVLDDAKSAVEDCRQLLAAELANGVGEAVVKELTDGEDEDREEEVPPRIGVLRNRLNNALEVQHMATFFVANAWYQIKTNEELTKPDTPIFAEVEKRETERYEEAKKLRQEILSEVLGKTNRMLRKLEKLAAAQSFAEMPAFSIKEKRGGIESHMIWERLDDLAAALDTQAEQIDEWRERVVQLLRKPLVDAGDEDEITGEEYEQSTKLQDEVVAYLEVLRAAIEDRHDALTGQFSVLVEQESKEAIQRAKDSDGVAPELRLKLWQKRAAIKPVKTFSSKDHQIEGGKSSLNGIISEIRASITALKNDVQKGRGRTGELGLLEELSKEVQRHRLAQTKAVTELKQEIDTFTRIDNLRVEYYRQLQQVSDMVAPLPEDTPADFFDHQLAIEMKTAARIASATSKRRYLIHLKDEGTSQATERICVICQAPFETGSLTVCGHIFCKECIHLWWHAHHNCPICKRKLTQNDLHDITYRPQDLKVVEETPAIQKDHERSPGKVGRGIYSQINQETLNDIKNIELSGSSFTSKVDTLCRHLLWLRNSDPGAKSIVFSQFSQYLEVLSRAFDHHRIGWASLDGGGVDKFKSNSSTEVFLLHARSQSSGLNLVNASHVFLCEPVVNTALELQAIARVDRIGQSQRTTVWLYLVEGTVEENVYEISVQRRLKHIGNGKGSAAASRARTPELDNKKIEAANSAELQDARLGKLLSKGKTGGEVVPREDLWDCLFGNRAGRKEKDRVANEAVEREVARHLGAEAAEGRAAAAEGQAQALMARR
jgi:E3 ubiquitin-protein ligase SHPRH